MTSVWSIKKDMDSVSVSANSGSAEPTSQSSVPANKARARQLMALASECPRHHVACYRSLVSAPGGVAVIVDPIPGAPVTTPKSEAQFRRWARQLMRAIRYLHSRGVIHGHITPQVILVDGDRLTLAGAEKRPKTVSDKRRAKAADYADGASSLLEEAASDGASRTTGLLRQIIAEAESLDLEGVEAIVAAL